MHSGGEQPRMTTEFVIFKSYDGGKHWERERGCSNFSTAADTAQALRSQNPSIRFRVDVEPRGSETQGRKRQRA